MDGHSAQQPNGSTAQRRLVATLGGRLQSFLRRISVGRIIRLSVGLFRPTSVCCDRPMLVPTANKQGKNVACIASAAGGSLWRRDGSVWRFWPLESDVESPYICIQATGHIARLRAAVEIDSPAIRPKTDFYVRQNIARCVSSYSILFGLLPKTLPLQGAGLSLRSRAALISNLRSVTVRWLMSRNH